MPDYSLLDRLLHRLALGSRAVAEMSFDLQQGKLDIDLAAAANGRHIFVSGLARSGSTILMRRLYETGAFASLTYRDMPFILAPGMGTGTGKDTPLKERAHGDRILVNQDSPEALDEVFWRVFSGADYIGRDRLTPHVPDAEALQKYVAYVGAILAASNGRTRYLSKTNNSLLRLQSLQATFPNALILVPFRDPLTHAESLRKQHVRFTAGHERDTFSRDYMRWLGHHEFGSDHRPFRFGESEPVPLETCGPETLDYWAGLWCNTYDWLLKTAPDTTVFVSYEQLCADPEVWAAIATQAGLEASAGEETFSVSRTAPSAALDPHLAGLAADIHARLIARAHPAATDTALARQTTSS